MCNQPYQKRLSEITKYYQTRRYYSKLRPSSPGDKPLYGGAERAAFVTEWPFNSNHLFISDVWHSGFHYLDCILNREKYMHVQYYESLLSLLYVYIAM